MEDLNLAKSIHNFSHSSKCGYEFELEGSAAYLLSEYLSHVLDKGLNYILLEEPELFGNSTLWNQLEPVF